MTKAIFGYNGAKYEIQCSLEDKMENICNNFATKILGTNTNSLVFLYSGSKINFGSTFKESLNSFDKNKNQMTILAYKKSENQKMNLSVRNVVKILI